jgi:hypothetical protein
VASAPKVKKKPSTPLAPKSTPAKPVPQSKAGKKAPGGIDWGGIGDNLVPDNLNKIPDAITPDNIPNPLTGLEAIGKVTTQLFNVSFWIRAAFIIAGMTLIFIGTKALLSGSAQTSPSPQTPQQGGIAVTKSSSPSKAPSSKPYGAKAKGGPMQDIGEVGEVAA